MNGAVTVAKMEPRGSSVSPLHTRKRSRILGLRKSTPGSRSGRSNGWAECREKKIGIEPKGSTFLLTFPLIGHCYVPNARLMRSYVHPLSVADFKGIRA